MKKGEKNMKLGEYIKKNYLTQSHFVRIIPASRQQVSNWVTGKVQPRQHTMKRIKELTGGKVDFHDWFID